jgi:3-hydroxybutyrate dehydrogenase
MKLTNRIAFITGSASGIGKEIAHTFLREGAKVVITDNSQTLARRVAAELGDSGSVVGVGMDPTNEMQVEQGMTTAANIFGRIDILVCNANTQAIASLDQCDFSAWKHLLAVHLDGAFLTTRSALRVMYRRGVGGSIIYTASVHSKEASVLMAPYVTARHGLLGLAKVVAMEGARNGVRANVICPGIVRTSLVESQIFEQARGLGITDPDIIRNIILDGTIDSEFTTEDDVAETALFLAAFESNALTGQSLFVSHGWSMQ